MPNLESAALRAYARRVGSRVRLLAVVAVAFVITSCEPEAKQREVAVSTQALILDGGEECNPTSTSDTVCDAIDEDCDGESDEDCSFGPSDCPAGMNVIVGTAAADTINGTSGADCIIGYGGNDHLKGKNGNDYIVGGPGNDLLRGEVGDDEIHGGAGDDTIYGYTNTAPAAPTGTDTLYGDEGKDKLHGIHTVQVVADGGPGNDDVMGGGGNDVLHGGDGSDYIYSGTGGADEMYGDDCHDQLEVVTGLTPAVLEGGRGFDACDGDCEVSRSEFVACWSGSDCLPEEFCPGAGRPCTPDEYTCTTVTLGSDGGTCEPVGSNDATCDGVDDDCDESLDEDCTEGPAQCPSGMNVIVGTPASDSIHGTAGADCILGYGGGDELFGHEGNDYIVGGAGNDYIAGGAGDDELHGGAGNDDIHSHLDVGSTTPNGLDSMYGEDGDDDLQGQHSLGIYAEGGPGHDDVMGGSGDDELHGGDGSDYVYSGADGTDEMYGDDCHDQLEVAAGAVASVLVGGRGFDACDGDCEVTRSESVPCWDANDCESDEFCPAPGRPCTPDTFECDTEPSCTPVGSTDATCDGVDDDCSTVADEDYASQSTNCGVGACAATGTTTCVSGAVQDSCIPGTPAANDASCNGVDNDCSGAADEDYASQSTNCGVGACAATGTTSCVSGAVQDSCTPGTPAANDAICNGIDDDCSGAADEDYVSLATSCGIGACSSVGATSCTGGVVQNSCAPGTPAASDATCNGIDDDCNGIDDENYTSLTTSCGVGACVRAGATSCVSGAVQDSCVAGTPAASDLACDGVDADCDGSDGNCACDPSVPTSCVGGNLNTCSAAGQLSVTVCDDANTCTGVEACAAVQNIPVTALPPKATFLRTNSDTPQSALILTLSQLGLTAGDRVTLRSVGRFKFSNSDTVGSRKAIAVFSSSNTLSATNVANRVPGAVQSDAPNFVTFNTFIGNVVTDIPRDFAFDNAGTAVTVPSGAQYLFLGTHDDGYSDNANFAGESFGFVVEEGHVCQPGTPLVLSDGNQCTQDVCHPTTGVSHPAEPAGTACNDNLACTSTDACDGVGVCLGTPDVDDGDPCTTDICNLTTGAESHPNVPAGTSCEDGDACNGAETCNAPATQRIQIDPRGQYLRWYADDDPPVRARVLSLNALGYAPGDTLWLAATGSFLSSGNTRTDLLGLFSASSYLSDENVLTRVPHALPSGVAGIGTPHFGITRDIPQDFAITQAGRSITIPPGATHLLIAANSTASYTYGNDLDADFGLLHRLDAPAFGCQSGAALDTNDDNACTVDSCDSQSGVDYQPYPEGALDCESQALECGSGDDGCGGTLDCGGCSAGQECGGQVPNTCGPPGLGVTPVIHVSKQTSVATLVGGASVVESTGSSPSTIIDEVNGGSTFVASVADKRVTVRLEGTASHVISSLSIGHNTAPTGFQLWVSDREPFAAGDLVLWHSFAPDASGTTTTSFAPVRARYVRLRVTATVAAALDHLRVYTRPRDGGVVSLYDNGARVVAVSSEGGSLLGESGAHSAIDFSHTTVWSTVDGANEFLVVKLSPEGRPVSRFELQAETGGTRHPKNIRLSLSSTGTAPADFTQVLATTLTRAEHRFVFEFPAMPARYARLDLIDNYSTATSDFQIADVKLLTGSEGGAIVPFDDLTAIDASELASVLWEFGDGTSSTERHPLHTYSGPGTYLVSLRVTDTLGRVGLATTEYTVLQPPTVNFDWSPVPVLEHGPWTRLIDLSSTTEGGELTAWTWSSAGAEFLGGANPSTVTRNYHDVYWNQQGMHPLTLTAIDSQFVKGTGTKIVEVLNVPPDFSPVADSAGYWGKPIWLGNATGAIDDYNPNDHALLDCLWDYGDATPTLTITNCRQVGNRVSHVYASPGDYLATASGRDDVDRVDQPVNVTVHKRTTSVAAIGMAPTAVDGDFELSARLFDTVDPTVSMAGMPVRFTHGTDSVVVLTGVDSVARTVVHFEALSYSMVEYAFEGDALYQPSADLVDYLVSEGATEPMPLREHASSHEGTHFVLVATQNSDGYQSNEGKLVLHLTSRMPTQATISSPVESFTTTVPVNPGTPTRVELPLGIRAGTGYDWSGSDDTGESGLIELKGFEVTSAEKVSAVLLNRRAGSSDAYLGYPVERLGTEYVVAAYHNAHFRWYPDASGTQFTVVATEDDTHLSIIPSDNLKAGPALPFGAPRGELVTFTLDKFEVLTLSSEGPPDRYEDLTGSLVSADKKVAVFGGNSCGVFNDSSTCDLMVKQVPPSGALGTRFVSIPFPTSLHGMFRVVASHDDTEVRVDGVLRATLARGEHFSAPQSLVEYHDIQTSKPAHAVQFSSAGNFGVSTTGGDPFLLDLVPESQLMGDYVFVAVQDWRNTTDPETVQEFDNWLTVVGRVHEVGGIRLDGQPIQGPWIPSGANKEFAGHSMRITPGEHRLTHADPGARFSAYVYGYRTSEGYGYATGRDLHAGTCVPTQVKPGDGTDNDCDGLADEELLDGIDNDGDGLIDEDLALQHAPNQANHAPVLYGAGTIKRAGPKAGHLALAGFDADGDPLTFQVQSKTGTGVATFAGGVLTVTGGSTTNVTVIANDGHVNSAPATYIFTQTSAEPCRDFEVPLCTYNPFFWPSTPGNQVLTVNPGQLLDYTFKVAGKDYDLDPITWRLNSGPAGMTLNAQSGVLHWVVDDTKVGLHQVSVTLDDGRGGQTTTVWTLDVRFGTNNQAPVVTSSPVTTVQVGELYSYQIAVSDADSTALTYDLVWSPYAMNLSSSGLLTWTPVAGDVGRHTVVVSVEDGNGNQISHIFDLDVLGSPLQVTSSPVLTAAVDRPYEYYVTAADSSAATEPLIFHLEDGPSGMFIGSFNGKVTWTPTAMQLGTHYVVVRVENGVNVGYQRYQIEVAEADVAPRISSTPVTEVPLGALYLYDVHASDLGQFEIHTYSLTLAPPGMTIDPRAGVIQWIPSALGSEPVTVRVTDSSGLTDTQSFTVDVVADTTAPVVTLTAVPDRVPAGGAITLIASASDDVQAQNLALEVDGIPLMLDAQGHALFTGTVPGLYWATATASDPEGNIGTATVAIGIEHPVDAVNPGIVLTSPAEDEELTYVHDVVGSISDDQGVFSFDLSIRRRHENAWQVIARGNDAQQNAVLGKLDTTLLDNGYYELRVRSEDLNGNTSELVRPFRVDGQAKVGPVQLSFVDMALPMAGIPITVVRNYDSRHKTKKDFGYGWSLDVKQGSVQHNRDPWDGTAIYTVLGEFQLPCQGVHDQKSHFVEVRLSARERYIFRPAIYNTAAHFNTCSGEVFYELVEGTTSGATLDIVDSVLGDEARHVIGTPQQAHQNPAFLDPGTLYYRLHPEEVFDPRDFLLVLQDGRRFQISVDHGIRSIEDNHGNQLSITSTGVHHSGGQSIWFTRDLQGRISELMDPAGRTVKYGYDLNGDLVRVDNALNERTRFVYRKDIPHHLQKIIGPTGREMAAMDYDSAGRVTEVCDAEQACAQSSYDVPNRRMVQTDATSRPVHYEYDYRGNVTSQTDALNHTVSFEYDARDNLRKAIGPDGSVATYTYDGNGNMLSRVLPYEAGENPADFTYQYTYNAFNERESVTLPSGGVIDYEYDAKGNQTAVKDGEGNVIASATFNTDGTLASRTDRFGTVTFAGYDVTGQPSDILDIFGEPIERNYDAAGRLVRHRERGTTMTFAYDALGRPTFSNYGGEVVTIAPQVCALDQDCDGVVDSADNCAAIANADQADSDAALPDAVAAWRFEEQFVSVITTAEDEIGDADAAYFGTPTPVPGVHGRALRFDLGEYLNTPLVVNQDVGSPGATMQAWVRPAGPQNDPQGIFKTSDQNHAWSVSIDTSDNWSVDTGTASTWHTGIPAIWNQWQHVAVVFSSTGVRLYVDGALRASTTSIGYGLSSIRLRIGGGDFIGGSIDEVAVHARPLTADEVARHHAGGLFGDRQGDACDPCAGNSDPRCVATGCVDADGDGYGALGASVCGAATEVDCNDGSAGVNPGATESSNDVDDNCDGTVDEGFTKLNAVTVAYQYGDPGNPGWTRLEGPTFGSVSRKFSASGRLAEWVKPNGDTFTRLYDASGRMAEEIDALGNSTTYVYDAVGRLQAIRDVTLDATTTFVRNAAGRVTDTTDGLDNTTHTSYRLGGRLESTTNARNFTTAFESTPTNSRTTDALARGTTTTLTNYGLPVATTYPGAGSPSTRSLYDGTTRLDGSQNFPAILTDEAERDRTLVYDAHSALSSATDLAGNNWRYSYAASRGGQVSYDVFSGEVNLTHDQGGVQAYAGMGSGTEYGDVGTVGGGAGGTFQHHLDSVTSPMGETTQFVRGANGRIEQVVYPDGGEKVVIFGADGRPDSVSLPQGTTLTYTHDAQRREVSRVSSLGEQRSFTYGVGNRVETMTDNTGITIYEYDSVGRFSGIVYPHGGAVQYVRDTLGRTTEVRVLPTPGAPEKVTTYAYDENGNLESIIDPFNGETIYVYDNVDRLLSRTLPNGVVTTYGYDDRDRVLSIEHKTSMGTVLQSVTYVRAPSGEPTKITREDGSYVELRYDAALRLDTEEYYDANAALVDSIEYDYDLDGNRTSKNSLSGGLENYAYSDGFKLDTVTRGSVIESFGYDGGGRIVSIVRDGALRTLEYNSDDKLTRVVDGAAETITYQYDGVGRRVGAIEAGAARRYLVAPNLGAGYETPQLVTTGTGAILEGYVFEGEHPLLRFDGNGSVEYLLQDAMGTVLGVVDADGALSADARWNAFGELVSGDVAGASVGGGFGLHGMWRDDATDLYYVRARTYDARTGRFTSRDPLEGSVRRGESWSPYVITMSNPALSRDPSGMFTLVDISVAGVVNGILSTIAKPSFGFYVQTARAMHSVLQAPRGRTFGEYEHWPEVPHGRTYKDPIPNGCGAAGAAIDVVPDRPFGVDFTDACDMHDTLWGTCDFPKQLANRMFLWAMNNACVAETMSGKVNVDFGLCMQVSIIYYEAVSRLAQAHDAYVGAQTAACGEDLCGFRKRGISASSRAPFTTSPAPYFFGLFVTPSAF